MLAALLLASVPGPAFATPCNVIPGISPANTPFYALATTDDSNDRRWTPGQPYWIAVGAIAFNPSDDFDVNVFNNTQNANLPCYTNPLGVSSRPAGQTDFVVGDFNHNPYAEYVNNVICYSGACDGQQRGVQVWRDGGLVFGVDTGPQVITLPALADRVVKIWDIYLLQGSTYHFRFQPTVGDNQPKLLLFRNPTGGVFWTGRYGAEFETANCVTNYTAPSTGYYGMVVVSDRYSTNPVSITLEVTTGPACACPPIIAGSAPQIIPPGATQFDAGLENLYGYDWVVGVRSTSDWDIQGGETAPGPDAGCMTTIQRTSTLLPPKTDFLLAERPYTQYAPDTFAVRAVRYSGSDGATLNSAPLLGTDSNAPGHTGYVNSIEIGKGWITYLWQDTTYSIRFFPGGDVKLLVFDHLAESNSGWHSRADAVLETSSSTSYTAPRYGVYGFVLVNDDGGIDNYDFAFGFCNSVRPLISKQPLDAFDPIYPGEHKPYFSFNQQASHWAAACVYGSSGLDWDIAQYGQSTGSPWPECLGAPGALSNGVVGADVIAGDFHHVPTGSYYLHSYRAGVNDQVPGYTEWDSGSGALQINPAQPTHVNVSGLNYSDRLWCYEAYLFGGFPYTLSFLAAGAASLRALVFENPGTAAYWAPRSAAILSTGATTSFTPASTGWHGIVVVNDNEQAGSFDLSLQSSVVATDAAAAPTRTELGAVAPNPAHGPLRIDYALSRSAQVSFEVLDLAGRVVCRIPAEASGAGRWSQVWDGRSNSGQSLAGGVYLLRMQVNGHTVATRKVMRLN